MSTALAILAPLVAAGFLLLAMQLAVRAVTFQRKLDYARHEDRTRPNFAARFPLPELPGSPLPQRLTVYSQLFLGIHREAVDAQTTYHASVVRSAACLIVAFCALAVSTTKFNEDGATHLVLVWIEVLSLAFLFFNFRQGRRANEHWIAKRIEAELQRQNQFIGLLFPSLAKSQLDLTSQFQFAAGQIKAQVLQDRAGTDVIERIDAFWADKRAAIEKATLSDEDISGEGLLIYLHKRPMRQLGWFTDSKMRLEHNAHARSERLAWLFGAAMVLSLLKLALLLFGDHSHAAGSHGLASILSTVLPPVLLIVTGWSAAEAAYYLNQNARSLIHRYDTQLRRMFKWFTALNAALPVSALPAVAMDASTKAKARTLILEFEDLMVEELNDWIHIAKTDTIEIAP